MTLLQMSNIVFWILRVYLTGEILIPFKTSKASSNFHACDRGLGIPNFMANSIQLVEQQLPSHNVLVGNLLSL